MLTLNYRDSRPLYGQIKDGLRRLIVTGALAPNEKLPSVRSLAMDLAINPNTIQRAYRLLEEEGWIATVPGKGCFVCGLRSYTESEKQELLEAFDKAAAALLKCGATRAELAARLEKEVT